MSVDRVQFDWTAVKERLRKAQEALEGSITMSPERTAEILETRARALAKPHDQENGAPRVRVLLFVVGAETYAIETKHLHGVLRLTELTPLPDAPPYVVGIANIRGEIVPLFDLRHLLGRGSKALTDLANVIVVGSEQPELGILADVATETIDLPPDHIHSPAASLAGENRDIVRGVTRDAVTVLSGDAICRDARLFITTRNAERK